MTQEIGALFLCRIARRPIKQPGLVLYLAATQTKYAHTITSRIRQELGCAT
jgi:hypothetical protein